MKLQNRRARFFSQFFSALFLVVAGGFCPGVARAGGTVVGNGGDPILNFMEAARAAMISTIKIVDNSSAEKANFCVSPRLTPVQTSFCQSFFSAISDQLLELNQGNAKTPFVLRADPLLVEGPDGKPMMVAARTELGPNGPIELHRDSVKTFVPVQALQLIAHEFQHKSAYRNRFMTDNEQIGPFASGRELIDAVAGAIVTAARKNGQVGSQFGIHDIFNCHVFAGGLPLGSHISVPRLFLNEDLMSYETSDGKNPLDGSVYVEESEQSTLIFRFVITEPNNCGPADPRRQNLVQIVRSQHLPNGGTNETVIKEHRFDENPICPGANGDFAMETDAIRFACKYIGSEGTTSSPYSLRSLTRPTR
jgi:hypothetical protein